MAIAAKDRVSSPFSGLRPAHDFQSRLGDAINDDFANTY
jgi:hypothetical protein